MINEKRTFALSPHAETRDYMVTMGTGTQETV